ncbi:MAG: trypsin-like serine protease [Deltaproteobacteria bacterium]|nr:trypsin-like serine protease [Deltaproteobacteria bacterium]
MSVDPNHCIHRCLLTLAPVAALAAWACDPNAPDDTIEADTPRIIGGFPAQGPVFDPIGAFGAPLDPSIVVATHSPFCTGALIAPNAVLTAEHCVDLLSEGDEFLIGFDGTNPDRAVGILGFVTESTISGGVLGQGSDIAVVILAEPIEDIEPVGFGTVSETDVGDSYIGVGYGMRDNFFSNGQRYLGQMDLLGIGGSNHALNVWGNFERFAAQIPSLGYPPNLTPEMVLSLFDLLEDYEATFGGAPGNAQTCFGDSGGPVMRLQDGQLTVFGVASATVSTTTQLCDWGGIYATLGPAALDLVQAALACDLVTAQGTCDGVSTVQRCKPPIEGGWDVVETDCSLFGLVCGEDPAGTLTCVPDPCEVLPPGGSCAGDVAMTCSEPGDGPRQVVETDCAAFQTTCGLDDQGQVTCIGASSCEGNCGGSSPGPNDQICFCDQGCGAFDDCCDDYVDACVIQDRIRIPGAGRRP